jgi:hypothetical protein
MVQIESPAENGMLNQSPSDNRKDILKNRQIYFFEDDKCRQPNSILS